MRSLLFAIALATAITACTSKPPAAEPVAAAQPAAPQCYSGDHGKFFALDTRETIAGVEVVCTRTSDGKAAQWMGAKAKH